MIEIWDKNKIATLTDTEKEAWFDVYNYKLEQDRNILLSDPHLKEKQAKIKKDYFEYIDSCVNSKNFYKYYILKYEKRIVSQCRINIYENKYFLEGLQTHKDYYNQGYATNLIKFVLSDLNNDGIKLLYSEVRVYNDASNKLHQKIGFTKYAKLKNNNLYKLDIR